MSIGNENREYREYVYPDGIDKAPKLRDSSAFPDRAEWIYTNNELFMILYDDRLTFSMLTLPIGHKRSFDITNTMVNYINNHSMRYKAEYVTGNKLGSDKGGVLDTQYVVMLTSKSDDIPFIARVYPMHSATGELINFFAIDAEGNLIIIGNDNTAKILSTMKDATILDNIFGGISINGFVMTVIKLPFPVKDVLIGQGNNTIGVSTTRQLYIVAGSEVHNYVVPIGYLILSNPFSWTIEFTVGNIYFYWSGDTLKYEAYKSNIINFASGPTYLAIESEYGIEVYPRDIRYNTNIIYQKTPTAIVTGHIIPTFNDDDQWIMSGPVYQDGNTIYVLSSDYKPKELIPEIFPVADGAEVKRVDIMYRTVHGKQVSDIITE